MSYGGKTQPAFVAIGHTPFGVLRVFLALLVVWQHVVARFSPDHVAIVGRPFEAGSIAVLLFFVLSGHIIDEAAELVYRERPFAFLVNRILRILPTYVVGLAAFLLVCAVLHGAGFAMLPVEGRPLVVDDLWSPRLLLANLGAMLPIPQSASWIASQPLLMLIIWAVRIEMMFYLAYFGLLLVAWATGMGMGRILTLAGLAVLVVALPALAEARDAAIANAPFFVLGIAHRRLRARAPGDRLTAIVAGLFAAVALALCIWRVTGLGMASPLAEARLGEVALFLGLLAAFVALTGVRIDSRRALTRFDQKVGELTYPIYIDHMTAVLTLQVLGAARSWWFVGLAMLAAVLFSWAIAAVSEPAISRLRDRVRGRRLR